MYIEEMKQYKYIDYHYIDGDKTVYSYNEKIDNIVINRESVCLRLQNGFSISFPIDWIPAPHLLGMDFYN